MFAPKPLFPALLLTFALTACDEHTGPLQVDEDAFSWQGPVAAGKTLFLREMQGGIEVVPAADDTLRVTARTEWRSGDPETSLRFSANDQDGNVLICAMWNNTGTCTSEAYSANVKFGKQNRTDAKVYFRVEVPAGVRLDLVSIDGSISATSTAPVRARTLNGDVRVATAVGPVKAETMNGSVDVRMSSIVGTDTVEAKTLNGSAFVYLPDGIDAALDLSVMNGSVGTEFTPTTIIQRTPRKFVASLGKGTHPVRISTINGEAALRRLDAEGKSGNP